MESRKFICQLITPLALVMGLFLGAVSASGAALQATADPADPAFINAGGSDTVQLHSKLVATQNDEENLAATNQWWDITSVSVSSDDVNWTVVWTGDATAANGTGFSTALIVSSGSSATLQSTFALDSFWQIDVVTTADYTVTINGQQQNEGPISSNAVVTNHTVADVTAVSVATANGATQTNMVQNYPNQGDQNWGIVKSANTSVIMQVTTVPGTDPVWKQVAWHGGSTIASHDDERSYSAATSQEYKVKPTINGKGLEHTLNLWVIWATVTIDSAGTDPANAPAFPAGTDGGQSLGIQYDAAKDNVSFNNCQVALMTPSGVRNVVNGGCVMKQEREIHDFANITQHGQFWDTGWVSDGPGSAFYTTKPDSADKVYAIDAPDQYLQAGETQDDEYGDFRDWLEWNGRNVRIMASGTLKLVRNQRQHP
ncbi:MAG: hypothetical protein ACP5I8_15795 [Phycisphaerae bacterium]